MNKLRPADRFKVFHGSYSDKPPHEYETNTFHAGTYEAAMDRLATAEQEAADVGLAKVFALVEKPKMHMYEIRVQPSMLTYDDPDAPFGFAKGNVSYNQELAIKNTWGDSPGRVLKYINRYEDPGSLSYVIPIDFVKQGLVHYLGDQFTNKRFYKA